MKKKIVVFAGSFCNKEKQDYYYTLAYKTGKLLAKAGFLVATGGGPGLMNEVSRGAVENGGETLGVCINIPGRKHSKYLTRKLIYNLLRPRQEKLLSLGDGYLALPGGIGTLYEISAVLALKRKKEIPLDKPFIVIDGYYQEFKILLEKMEEEGFIDNSLNSLFIMVKTPEEAVKKLRSIFHL